MELFSYVLLPHPLSSIQILFVNVGGFLSLMGLAQRPDVFKVSEHDLNNTIVGYSGVYIF